MRPELLHTPAIFAPQYFGSVPYYAAMSRHERVCIDLSMRYDKRQKSVHRCDIIDTQGPLRLTVPVSLPKERITASPGIRLRWCDVTVSSHGQWWQQHIVSLESAYGRTPFFEFYIDRLLPWLCDSGLPITELDRGTDEAVRSMLHMPARVEYATGPEQVDALLAEGATDYRASAFADVADVPYYQVRAHKHGFVGRLSILDLLFNVGPEAPLVLAETSEQVNK